ncbi:MAG: hypothetical protein H0U10_15675, partial [Chloroflexia bacterium]|nr:hypothetical protein [Chloroflexia bacterium]
MVTMVTVENWQTRLLSVTAPTATLVAFFGFLGLAILMLALKPRLKSHWAILGLMVVMAVTWGRIYAPRYLTADYTTFDLILTIALIGIFPWVGWAIWHDRRRAAEDAAAIIRELAQTGSINRMADATERVADAAETTLDNQRAADERALSLQPREDEKVAAAQLVAETGRVADETGR